MSDTIKFTLDGKEVEAQPGETIWEIAKSRGNTIPHLCHRDKPGYRADANCRACVVEVEGERVLSPSCRREPTPGMVVKTDSERATKSRAMVFELLLSDMPAEDMQHDKDSLFSYWTKNLGIDASRFPARANMPATDDSHVAMAVNLDACINCNLCVRACREIQVNDVIGMAHRGSKSKIVFDFDDPMGDSSCVACGECVQACPTGALLPATLVDENQVGVEKATKQVNSMCPFCGVGCQVTYHVKDNKVQFVEGRDGPANENRMCVKGRYGTDYVSSPERLTKPLIRRDDAPKNAHEKLDPSNPLTHFREASWEEALDFAAKGLKTIHERDGKYALAGFGSAKGSNEEAYMVQKFVRAGFGSNNVDHCTRLCHASSVAALMEGINSGAVTAPFGAAKDADVIFLIGARPNQNHPVAASYIKNACKKGAKLIILDPRGQRLARHASHMIQFKPGADVPLLNAMIYTIIEEGLTDDDYIAKHVEGYEEVKANIKDYAPEKMAAFCGIDAETIREVARLYATADRSLIFWGMGISQHVHGTDNSRCLITMAMITGQMGRPGTGLHPLRGQNNVQGASDVALIPMVYPDYESVEDDAVRKVYEELWDAKLDSKRGLTVVEIMDEVYAGNIKGVFLMGENPAMSDPDANHAREALAKLEHFVVQDIFLTETAFLADVILPSSSLLEKTGTVSNTNREIQMLRPALDMPGDAKQDWWIIQEVANRFGLNWNYTHPKDVYAEMQVTMRSLDNISWERLEREDAVTFPCEGEDVPGTEILWADGYATPNGKAKIIPARLIPPDELPDDEYPTVLTTGRQLEHWHTGSMTRRSVNLDALEGTPVVSLHPRELGEMGLKAGDMIKVESRRGEITLMARGDRDVPEGMIFIPFCYHEAAANLLTNPKLDPFGKIPEFKYCAVRISAAEKGAVAAE